MGKQDQQPGSVKTHKTLGFLGYWWLCRALLPAAHVAPTVSLHTPFVDSSVSKNRLQRVTLLASAVFFNHAAAPQSPCASLAGMVAVLWLLRH
jgi:hypothetical protein